jgi:2,4-dichlorophenol 6-monooxygenase
MAIERLTLLTGDGDAGFVWAACGWSAAREHRLAFTAFTIGDRGSVPDSAVPWHQACEVGPDGAVLVRPDGLIAWRATTLPENPLAAISGAMEKIVGKASLRAVS